MKDGHPSDDQLAVAATAVARLRRRAPRTTTLADVFLERTSTLSGRFADGKLVDSTWTSEQGACARQMTRDTVRHAYGGYDTDQDALRLVDELHGGDHGRRAPPEGRPGSAFAAGEAIVRVMELLRGIDRAAREHDDRIVQTLVDFEVVHRAIAVGSLDQDALADERQLSYLVIRCIARKGNELTSGYLTPGGSGSSEAFDPTAIGVEAADRAVAGLDARAVPAGHAPVVIGPGRGMVLIHEACCHPVEGDQVLQGSIFRGRLGSRVAAPVVTITDDPSIPTAVGSYRMDDEGTVGGPTMVVEEGRLVSYLTDRVCGAQLGRLSTGNGRRASFRDTVVPRMSNTCVAAGSMTQREIVADTRFGIFAEHVAGGEVVESTGDFVFRVSGGYLIRNGELTDRIKETTVAGNGIEVLESIDRVGDDVQLGAAKCGKFGQFVTVGVMGPTLRVGSLLVGGSSPR